MLDIKLIPIYIRIMVGMLAIANVVYGIIGYFNPSQIFENSIEGIDISGRGAKYAGFEYASRNLAIGLGLMIVAFFGASQSIAIVVLIRAFIELQTIFINIAIRKFNEGFVTAIVFLAVELTVIIVLFL